MARLLGFSNSTFLFLTLLLVPVSSSYGAGTQHFQPLKSTLQEFGIDKLPEAADYPDIPAIAVLSYQEYKQGGQKHTRRYHRIIKILTPQGKEYTNLHLPCFSTCHIEARTIKPGGKILNLPAKDLFRNQNLSGYRSPYFVAQFAMPGVEAGDIIEYLATVDYPVPLYLEDFKFSEPYPILKGVFVLTHAADDAYSYVRQLPPGFPAIRVSQSRVTEGSISLNRTTFVVDNVPAAVAEEHAPTARRDIPGIRLLLDVKGGRRFEIFKDWFAYGEFIASQIAAPSMLDNDVILFAEKAAGNRQDIREIISAIYSAAEKHVQISEESIWMSGFEFRSAQQILKDKTASPHEFAVFLAACFRLKRWTSDLVLVNSHLQAETSKDRVFPPDLDFVFLNVKTPIGEFVLDCTQNDLPALQLSSAGMNRFALGIPLFVTTTRFTKSNIYTSRTTFRSGNRSHLNLVAISSADEWQLEFQWTLAGEFQTDWVRYQRENGEEQLRTRLNQTLRARFDVTELNEVTHSFTMNGFQVKGKASKAKVKAHESAIILLNDIWDPGLEVPPFIFENRVNPVLLPAAGEFSSTLRVKTQQPAVIPQNVRVECAPATYSLSFQKQNGELVVEESLTFRDIEVKPAAFSEFSNFLSQYYEKHFWAILFQ